LKINKTTYSLSPIAHQWPREQQQKQEEDDYSVLFETDTDSLVSNTARKESQFVRRFKSAPLTNKLTN
jgi:hypothetical protein